MVEVFTPEAEPEQRANSKEPAGDDVESAARQKAEKEHQRDEAQHDDQPKNESLPVLDLGGPRPVQDAVAKERQSEEKKAGLDDFSHRPVCR